MVLYGGMYVQCVDAYDMTSAHMYSSHLDTHVQSAGRLHVSDQQLLQRRMHC